MDHVVRLSRVIEAPPLALFRAFTTPGGLISWCANAAELNIARGDYLFLWSEKGYQFSGTISDIVTDENLTWNHVSPETGSINIRIRIQDDETSQVVLSMYGVYRSDSHIAFWSEALNNLKAVLETGFDRRIYDRPMLGILIGGLISEESQAHFASPVDYGIRLSGTVPGMGAEKLGMIENDILTEMNNEEIHDYRVLEKIVSRFKSGDVTQVTWYRGGHKLTGEMAFSGRPTPFVPPFPAELADYVESIYRRSDSELASILEGVVEVQAEYRPFEHEWNIKQILAHTIVMERSLHLWITATRKGELMKPWFTNDQELIDSVVSTYPSLEQLVFELKCAQKLTVNLLRRLPPELATLKAPYLNIVTNLGEQGVPLHTRMHFESIKALLAEQN